MKIWYLSLSFWKSVYSDTTVQHIENSSPGSKKNMTTTTMRLTRSYLAAPLKYSSRISTSPRISLSATSLHVCSSTSTSSNTTSTQATLMPRGTCSIRNISLTVCNQNIRQYPTRVRHTAAMYSLSVWRNKHFDWCSARTGGSFRRSHSSW